MLGIKSRLNPQFMYGLDQYTQIMAEHLTQYLIELPDIALAPHGISKLCLDHAKGCLDIRPDTVGEPLFWF